LGLPSADRDYQPGHARMLDLLKILPCQRPKLRIRIAGTNGKGSTAFMLAAALQAAGLKVGLYTSPHILDFNERIRIQGIPISDAQLLTLLEEIMPIALDVGASYFEVATALALCTFSRAHVDVEILEAGVGARFDATTAVPADMALITPIGLDHEAWLGDTLAAIAEEKAFALHGCQWGLSSPQPADVMRILNKHHNKLTQVTPEMDMQHVAIGAHQAINASLALKAAQTLADAGLIKANNKTLKDAISSTKIPGRLQHITYHSADIWLDAAHNHHAIEALLPTLPTLAEPLDAILIFTRADRSLLNSLAALRPHARLLVGDIEGHFDIISPNPETALQEILCKYPAGKILLLGSFLTVSAALKWLQKEDT